MVKLCAQLVFAVRKRWDTRVMDDSVELRVPLQTQRRATPKAEPSYRRLQARHRNEGDLGSRRGLEWRLDARIPRDGRLYPVADGFFLVMAMKVAWRLDKRGVRTAAHGDRSSRQNHHLSPNIWMSTAVALMGTTSKRGPLHGLGDI